MWTRRCISPCWRIREILVPNPPSPIWQERVCQYDAGLLRHRAGGEIRPSVRRALDTRASFSLIGGRDEQELETNFDRYCGQVLNVFAEIYAGYYDEGFVQEVKSTPDARGKLNCISLQAHKKGYPLYLIIDEYDNFTNVILSDGGKDLFRKLTHASGFYRDYFKIFKAMFSRVFLIGVSPVTLDDLSSGYNIDWNISQDPRFNDMLGFSENDVRTMFHYFQDNGKLRAEADIEAMLEEMKPWYNNYCFAEECVDKNRVYNCNMVLYYLRNQILYGHSPEEMVDKNNRTDFKRLKMLTDNQSEGQWMNRMSVIEGIAATGTIKVDLKTSFPAEYVTDDNNFLSLLYCYGLLTMHKVVGRRIEMVIPNHKTHRDGDSEPLHKGTILGIHA